MIILQQPMSVYSTVYNKRVGICYSHNPLPRCPPMVTQTDIPSHLTDDDKASSFQTLDATLNSTILYTLLHGGQQRHSVSWHVGID